MAGFRFLLGLVLLGCATSERSVVDKGTYSGRIFNGQSAALGQFPYQCLLNIILPYNYFSYCGAALISHTWVLTAAHCVHTKTEVRVYCGLIDSAARSTAFNAMATAIEVHHEYNNVTMANDIALIQMSKPAPFSSNIKPISLPQPSLYSHKSYDGGMATASGWGKTHNEQAGMNRFLQFATIHVQSWDDCNIMFSNFHFDESNICTDKTVVNASPCKGDSGGPLAVMSSTGSYVLAGLVSWAVGPCDNPYPNVYVSVVFYFEWIKDVIAQHSLT